MRKTGTPGKMTTKDSPHACILAVNAATVAFVDELLRLPSSAAAATVVSLLYGETRRAPVDVLGHVNGGIHIPLAALLVSPEPLAHLVAERLRVGAAWRATDQAIKRARAEARARYRGLASAFVASTRTASAPAAAALVRYTYGIDGRQWLWSEAAARVLHRMVTLNRAALDLLAAAARGEIAADAATLGGAVDPRDFDLPPDVLDLMAASMPPLAVPDWRRFTEALAGSGKPLAGDEATSRYQSLLAEILGLGQRATAEVPA